MYTTKAKYRAAPIAGIASKIKINLSQNGIVKRPDKATLVQLALDSVKAIHFR
jgi:hypothetical protein